MSAIFANRAARTRSIAFVVLIAALLGRLAAGIALAGERM